MSTIDSLHRWPDGGDPVAGRSCGAFHTVAIGASAGGLEALEHFFDAVAEDSGLAFVVIQHLSPDFKSHMQELLGRKTAMPIHRVTNQMTLEPDTIYLLPASKHMQLAGGVFILTDRSDAAAPSYPIDAFFESLAQDVGRHAIGVILSGTGTDGSAGVQAIHRHGGLVMCQDGKTAKFDGMPVNALATGVVDIQLAPEAMPDALLRYVRESVSPDRLASLMSPLPALPQNRLLGLLHDASGVDFSQYKQGMIERRLARRMDMDGIKDLGEFCDYLERNPAELDRVYADLLIGVTRLFRDTDAFEELARLVLVPLLDKAMHSGSLRIWVCGCATGEEVYSLAMLIDELVLERSADIEVKLFATDVHPGSLEVAASGLFSVQAIADLAEARRERYFKKRIDGYQIAPRIRSQIVFASHNVLKDAPYTQLDLICCRNVLIYFDLAAQQKTLSVFQFALRDQGYLFLGPSETVQGAAAAEFEVVDTRWRLFRKWRNKRLPVEVRAPLFIKQPSTPLTAQAPARPAASTVPLLGLYDRVLEDHMPASILVDEEFSLLHTFAGAERYLKRPRGRISSNVLDLFDEPLRALLSVALVHALREPGEVLYPDIEVARDADSDDDSHLIVDLSVRRYCDSRTQSNGILVKFTPHDPAVADRSDTVTVIRGNSDTSMREKQLEVDLNHLREDLQAIIEEQESSNEELQAANEEMTSANEELQSTNEELQSVNEELYSVNVEHQKKIDELVRSNDDMDNLLALTQVGVLFLDQHLRIRRYTPQMARLFNLLPHDIGRSVATFTHTLMHDSLGDDIEQVIASGLHVQKRVLDRVGVPYLLRIAPYERREGIQGAALSLIDIQALELAEQEKDKFADMAEQSAIGQILMSDQGRILYANPAFCKLSAYSEIELGQLSIQQIDSGYAEEGFQLRFNHALSGQAMVFESLLETKQGERIPIETSANRLDAGATTLLYASVQDISGRVESEKRLKLYQSAFNASDSGLSISDATYDDNPLMYVNDAFVQMTGYARDEVIGVNCRILQGEDTDPDTVSRVRAAIAAGEPVRVTLLNYRKDGSSFWNDLNISPVHDDRGKATHFVAVASDVTDQVLQTRLSAEQEAQVRTLLNSTTEGIIGVEPEGEVTFINAAARQMLMLDEAVTAQRISVSDVLSLTMNADTQVQGDGSANEEPDSHEDTGVHKDSNATEETSAAEESSTAEVSSTKEESSTAEVSSTKEESSTDGEPGADEESSADRESSTDEKSRADKELSTDEKSGADRKVSSNHLYSEMDEAADAELIHRVLLEPVIRQSRPVRLEPVNLARSDKSEFSAYISVRPVMQAHSSIGAVITFADMSARVAQQQELVTALDKADAANQAKSAFLANMSHEIRTPLTAIMGLTDLVSLSLSDAEQIQNAHAIKQNAVHLLDIVNDVLDLSKIESEQLEVVTEDVAIPTLIGELHAMMSIRAAQKGIDLIVQCDSPIPQRISTDRVRMRQILINLIGNAIKFTQSGSVRVCLSATEDALSMAVVDTGIGIAPGNIEQIFKPFKQGDTDVAQRFGGTGLGLSICRRLISALNGTLTVQSEMGKGSTFTVNLPIDCDEQTDRTSELELESLGLQQHEEFVPAKLSGHILVAEDRPAVLSMLEQLLVRAGATVSTACDGATALQMVSQAMDSYDLLLLDSQMPELTGSQVVQSLRARGACMPMVALTAQTMKGDRERLLNDGFTAFLSKPVGAAELVDTLAHYLDTDQHAESAVLDVLVVEDHETSRRAICRIVERLGYRVRGAGSGAQAIQLVSERVPDMCLLDMRLPDAHGIDIYQSLIQLAGEGSMRVVALTGDVESTDLQRYKQAGIERVLAKPVDFETLRCVLQQPAG